MSRAGFVWKVFYRKIYLIRRSIGFLHLYKMKRKRGMSSGKGAKNKCNAHTG